MEPWFWACECLGPLADGFGFLAREEAEASMAEHRRQFDVVESAIVYGRGVE